MTTVILLGDTHLPRFGRDLPGPLIEGLQEAELILHAGDLTDAFVLEELQRYAPTHAVAGNNDSPELLTRLGLRRVVEVEGVSIGLTHGHAGPGRTTPERARRTFEGTGVDAIAFGHSHQPMIAHDGHRWLLNPGSPTDRRRQQTFSYLRLEVRGDRLRPDLVTYGRWR